eukprot:64621_1
MSRRSALSTRRSSQESQLRHLIATQLSERHSRVSGIVVPDTPSPIPSSTSRPSWVQRRLSSNSSRQPSMSRTSTLSIIPVMQPNDRDIANLGIASIVEDAEYTSKGPKSRCGRFVHDVRAVPCLRWLIPLCILLIGESLVILMYFDSANDNSSRIVSRMDEAFGDYHNAIKSDIYGYLSDLQSLGVVLTASDGTASPDPICESVRNGVADCSIFNEFLHPRQFAAFTADLISRKQGITALEWIPQVAHDRRTDYENVTSTYYNGNYHMKGDVSQDIDRPLYWPVFYLEPVAGNEAAILFNLGSNQVRLAALEKANATRTQVASGKILLVQESAKQSAKEEGFLTFDPVHLNRTVGGVQYEALVGFALGVFRTGDMMMEAVNSAGVFKHVRLAVFDQMSENTTFTVSSSGSPEYGDWLQSMHVSPGESTWTIEVEEDMDRAELDKARTDNPSLYHQIEIPVADRTWVLVGYALDEFIEELKSQEAMLILVVGSMIVAVTTMMFIVIIINLTADKRREKQRGVDRIIREKQRRNLVIEKRIREEKQFQLEKEKLFIAFTFHELRNPLNGVMGGLEYMDEVVANILKLLSLINEVDEDIGVKPLAQLESYEILEMISESHDKLGDCITSAKTLQGELSDAIESSDHVVDILDHVLDLSKLEAGKLILDDRPMNLSVVANSAMNSVRRISRANVKIMIQCDEPFWVLGSPRHLKQIFINMLSNSVKHTETGFVKLEIVELPGPSPCKCRNVHHVLIAGRIKDTGVGIPPDKQAKLFQKYVQAGFQSVGTGLGLVISQSLVELHQSSCPAHGVTGIQIVSPLPIDDVYRADLTLLSEESESTGPTRVRPSLYA